MWKWRRPLIDPDKWQRFCEYWREAEFTDDVGRYIDSLSPRNPIRRWRDRPNPKLEAARAEWRKGIEDTYKSLAESTDTVLRMNPSNHKGLDSIH